MDANELIQWIAYDKSLDEDFKTKTIREIALEQQKTQTAEEESSKILDLFRNLSGT